MDHSYEEIRNVTLDVLAGRAHPGKAYQTYDRLMRGVAEVFREREGSAVDLRTSPPACLSNNDKILFLEVFWTLFSQGIITLGRDDGHREFPDFRVSQLGQRIIHNQDAYFFHDVSSYEKLIKSEVRRIHKTTLTYLKEAMQAFMSGCHLSASVMLGVAAEHSFLLLIETATTKSQWGPVFKKADDQKTLLRKFNKFRRLLEPHAKNLTGRLKEDLDTCFVGIQSIIRNYRNESGHPTGKIIDREQTYVLLNLFIPYCKKIYQLRDFFRKAPAPTK